MNRSNRTQAEDDTLMSQNRPKKRINQKKPQKNYNALNMRKPGGTTVAGL